MASINIDMFVETIIKLMVKLLLGQQICSVTSSRRIAERSFDYLGFWGPQKEPQKTRINCLEMFDQIAAAILVLQNKFPHTHTRGGQGQGECLLLNYNLLRISIALLMTFELQLAMLFLCRCKACAFAKSRT